MEINLLSPTGVVIIISTLITGYLSAIAKDHVSSVFKERERQHTHRINVAREVHKIVNEASTRNFSEFPRDIEHIHSVLTDLDGVDEKMGKVMNRFVNLWRYLSAAEKSHAVHSRESQRTYKEWLDESEECRKKLVKWQNKIRAGK